MIILAVDSFKGSLSSEQIHDIIAAELTPLNVPVRAFPLADGGEGTVAAFGGERVSVRVTGPLLTEVESFYGVIDDGTTAVIEVAAACGLPLVPEPLRNPLHTTSYGVGQLIVHALDRGIRRFIIGLGGSATNDAGLGMLAALGYRFATKSGREVVLTGAGLSDIANIVPSTDRRLQEAEFLLACDVTNPLYGPNGAAVIFAPQKGATAEMVEQLDEGLRQFATLLPAGIALQPGAGAAGGLGAAFALMLKTTFRSGAELLLERNGFREALRAATCVITGEGKYDAQSKQGKAPERVLALARQVSVPCVIIAGIVEETANATEAWAMKQPQQSIAEAMEYHGARANLQRVIREQFIPFYEAKVR